MDHPGMSKNHRSESHMTVHGTVASRTATIEKIRSIACDPKCHAGPSSLEQAHVTGTRCRGCCGATPWLPPSTHTQQPQEKHSGRHERQG